MKILVIFALFIISLKASGQAPLASPPLPPTTSSGTSFGHVLSTDSLTHKITYSEWVKVDGAKAGELYDRAVAWLSKRNDSVENVFPVIKQKDVIRSRGYTWLTVSSPIGTKYSARELTRELFYTITIEVKDGGYRFTVSDFYFHYFANSIFSADKDSTLESVSNKNPHDSLTQRYFNKINSTANYFSASLKSYMEPSTTGATAKATAPDNMDKRVEAAGDELIKAVNQYYSGLGMTIGGAIIAEFANLALSSSVPIAATNYSPATYGPSPLVPVLEVAGGALIIVGTVDMIASYSHIKKAGRILKYGTKSEWGLGLTKTGGIGLSLTF